MSDLRTKYMGIDLKNPVIVSACGITGDIDGVRKCADHGAGAVVLKSMFEEIIIAQAEDLDRDIIRSGHPEAYNYIEAEIGMQMGSKPYIKFIENVRNEVSIPVIASVNCISSKWWVPYAKDIESAGAHALELNISHFPKKTGEKTRDIEKQYAEIVHEVTSRVNIPVAVKLGCYFTSLWAVLQEIVDAGASALVLFNRFYVVDVNFESKRFVPSMTLSAPQEMNIPLRWIGLVAGELNCDLAASTGIHGSESIIKMLMAGADVVQICTVLYLRGTWYIDRLLKEINSWLDNNNYVSVDDIRGIALKNTEDKDTLLKRLQYVKALNEASKYDFE